MYPFIIRKHAKLPRPTSTSPTSPPASSRSPHTLLPRRRRLRQPSDSSNDISDPVIGQVTSLGKFKCLDTGCLDLKFGRQADFRRHWENVHAPRKIEFFCPVDGCHRSKRPNTGKKSKGRSFGAREDKMREHVKTVHEKRGKRKRGGEEGDESGEMEVKKVRSDDAGFGELAETWAGQSGY